MEAYNLKAVIDLRSGAEIRKKPDLIMAGVEYYHISHSGRSSFRLLRLPEDIRESFAERLPADPWEIREEDFYAQIRARISIAIKQFARFVDVVYHQ